MSKPLTVTITLLVVALCMPLSVASGTEIAKYLGLRQTPVPVVGTGSMYPSLFWEESEGGPDNANNRVIEEYRTTPRMYRRFPGFTVLGRTYLKKNPQLGDLVTFQSEATRAILQKEGKDTSAGFIKRVLALPGDTVQLRDGYLYRNGVLVEEPYLYRPRSTYGESTVSDCTLLTIPQGMYFVLGDNRKTSSDSRGELGLVKDEDITFLLPYAEQTLYQTLWRDPSHDQDLLGTPTLNPDEFYRLVNLARTKRSLPAFRPVPALAKSSELKADEILAGNPGYSLSDSLKKAGYHNILTGELTVKGRFSAEELLTNILYFADTKEELMDPRYTDIGVSAVNSEVEGCPSEAVVVHLGGYLPAQYEAEVIESWRSLADNLRSIIPSWEKAQAYEAINQAKLQELLALYRRRLALAEEITTAMERAEWLTESQEAKIKADSADAKRSQQLAEELNNSR